VTEDLDSVTHRADSAIHQFMAGLVPEAVKRRLTRALRALGYQLVNVRKLYEFDGLHTVHNARFRDDSRFQSAWKRGFQASGDVDPGSSWRIHIGLWAASAASHIPGEFVEAGVNAGFLSSAILDYLDWQNLGKKFYLVDTFAGPVMEQFSPDEVERGRCAAARQAVAAHAYVTDLERVRRNYQQWDGIEIVQGAVPEILPAVKADSVAFLHLDMNCAYPEVEALRFFWDRLSRGGIVLLDDYAYFGYEAQGNALDALARNLGAEILALPTGQGMIVK
jgi:hypothetical protein